MLRVTPSVIILLICNLQWKPPCVCKMLGAGCSEQSYQATQWWIATAQFHDVPLCILLEVDLTSPAAMSHLVIPVTPKPLQHCCHSSYPSHWRGLSEYFPADAYSPSSNLAFILLACYLFCLYWSHKAPLYLYFSYSCSNILMICICCWLSWKCYFPIQMINEYTEEDNFVPFKLSTVRTFCFVNVEKLKRPDEAVNSNPHNSKFQLETLAWFLAIRHQHIGAKHLACIHQLSM